MTWSALTAFQEVAVAAGYGNLLNSTTANVTLLVPTNEAFLAALPWLVRAASGNGASLLGKTQPLQTHWLCWVTSSGSQTLGAVALAAHLC